VIARPEESFASLEKYAEVLRALIRQENDVTNQRTTWLLVSQGILFAAAAAFAKAHWVPSIVVASVGFVLALSIGQSLQNSYEARQYLKVSWRQKLESVGLQWTDFPPLDGGVPGVKVVRPLFPWTVIPRLFMVAWVALAIFFVWGPRAT
jgi:hypothetical protein